MNNLTTLRILEGRKHLFMSLIPYPRNIGGKNLRFQPIYCYIPIDQKLNSKFWFRQTYDELHIERGMYRAGVL